MFIDDEVAVEMGMGDVEESTVLLGATSRLKRLGI